MTKDEFSKVASDFFEHQKKFKLVQSKFEDLKSKFYLQADAYFENKESTQEFSFYDSRLKVVKSQRITIEFDVRKLKRKLDKKLYKSITDKVVMINDLDSLISYLRKCNVDPTVFKSFLNINESVNKKELDRLEELGKISKEDLDGCYKVKAGSSYYMVKEEKSE
jgi:hypothetical protein